MSDSTGPDDPSDSADVLLREIAAAPERAPPSRRDDDPERISHFRVVGRLGRGGMGIVYRAEDEALGRVVALKVLPPEVEADGDRRKRLLREARAAATITHPNIATVYEVGEANGRVFVAMELVEGETLRARIARGDLPIAAAIDVASQIARGLVKAHGANIVHRDLKPDNIMVTQDGRVKILDFGLAKLVTPDAATTSALGQLETATQEGHILGTPAYMSPEQASSGPIDARSDLFALGVILYEMTTGARPFAGDSAASTLAAVLRDEPEAPSSRSANVSLPLERAILRCLQKKPEHRFASAGELLDALTALPTKAAHPRSRVRVGALVLAACVGAGALFLRATDRRASTVASSPPGPSASSSSPRVIHAIDLPPPPTKVAAAAVSYAAGMRALHDDNWGEALIDFQRAAEADPTMGAAHLRVAMTGMSFLDPEERRASFRRASSLRASLDDRERAFMDALEPSLQRVRVDSRETRMRLEELAKREPLDVEILEWLSQFLAGSPAGLAAADRVLALEPDNLQALQNKAQVLLLLGRNTEARATTTECLARSVTTTDCLYGVIAVDAVEGKCADAERAARRLADREPRFGSLAVVAAGADLGLPAATMREELGRYIGGAPMADHALLNAFGDTQLAIVGGDFERARAGLRAEDVALRAHPTAGNGYSVRYQRTAQEIGIALEVGDDSAARAAARDFVERSASWSRTESLGGGTVDLSLYFARVAAGAAPTAEFEVKRRAWIDASLEDGAYPGLVWTLAYAATALTQKEAEDALAALPKFVPLTSIQGGGLFLANDGGIPDAEVGRAYLLAQKPAEALPYLQRAASSCVMFNSPFAKVHAMLDLGRAHEAMGDSASACAGYVDVLAHWANAKPRSLTVERARVRIKALGCKT